MSPVPAAHTGEEPILRVEPLAPPHLAHGPEAGAGDRWRSPGFPDSSLRARLPAGAGHRPAWSTQDHAGATDARLRLVLEPPVSVPARAAARSLLAATGSLLPVPEPPRGTSFGAALGMLALLAVALYSLWQRRADLRPPPAPTYAPVRPPD
jgi:hypothetical protein